jgi:excisionase family DNA binding protein
MNDTDRYLTVLEVAEMWAVSDDKVRADIRKGALPAYSINGTIRVRYVDALEYGQPIEEEGLTTSLPPAA